MPIKKQLQTFTGSLSLLRSNGWLLIVCSVAFFMASGMGLSNPVLSLYVHGFTNSTSLVGFFFTTFAVGRILITLPASHASSRWGRKNLMVLGAVIEGLGSLGVALATSYPLLILARLMQGIGSGIYTSAVFLVVADLASPQERGRINSLFQGSIILGLTVSPAIGGILADAFGMEAPIVLGGLLGFLSALLVLARFPAYSARAVARKPQTGADPAQQARSRPVSELFRSRNFMLIAAAAFLIFVSRAGSRDTLMPLLGHNVLGLDSTALGFFFTLIALSNLITIPLAGHVSDSRGRKPAILLGLIINGLALLLMGASNTYSTFLLGALLLGVGKGFGEPISVVYVTDISPTHRFGTAFGVFLTLRDTGLLLGPLILGWMSDLLGLRVPFFVNGAAMLVITLLFGVWASETLHRPAKEIPA